MKQIQLIYPAALFILMAVPAHVTAQIRPVFTPPITHSVPITLPTPTVGVNSGLSQTLLPTPTLQPSPLVGGAPSPQLSPSVLTDRDQVSGRVDQGGQQSVPLQVVPPAPPDREPTPDGGDEEPEEKGSQFPWWPFVVGCVLVVAFLRTNLSGTKA